MLPCAETLYLGPDHEPGHFIDRLDTPGFYELVFLLEKSVREDMEKEGKPYAIIGVDSSPVCGVHNTWYGSVNGSHAKIPGRGFFLNRFSDILAFDVFEAEEKVSLLLLYFPKQNVNIQPADILFGCALQPILRNAATLNIQEHFNTERF